MSESVLFFALKPPFGPELFSRVEWNLALTVLFTLRDVDIER